jgi:guanosine-3',5'-bis(diphosphate) 3'-pyrophosphohydrolase
MVATRSPERELYLTQVIAEVRQRLAELGIDAEVTGRPKHLWSIYEKMVVKGREFDDIFDLVGIRVIVDSVKDCYAALGSHPRHLASRCRVGSRTTSRCPSSTSTSRCTPR